MEASLPGLARRNAVLAEVMPIRDGDGGKPRLLGATHLADLM